MKIIQGARGSGKTTQLIEMAHKNGGYIVCKNPHQVAEMARDMNLSINFPLEYWEFLERHYFDKGIKEFYIDNVEFLIQQLSRVPVAAISIVGEE